MHKMRMHTESYLCIQEATTNRLLSAVLDSVTTPHTHKTCNPKLTWVLWKPLARLETKFQKNLVSFYISYDKNKLCGITLHAKCDVVVTTSCGRFFHRSTGLCIVFINIQ